eukprot:CAMPEP_0115845192 /NCGR_PEP_ID=MMETSP0287-20121206/9227_1 /TAXON_ID=412157 /ORGANISM="Chrysochromulina rotalis, Strain UIO044" /LENGTH=294 /DNA_ID=CAMNT_0003298961 /DNA_START=211 /DNA_END=1092 /DNA_ORIENTATION=+
MLQAAGSSSSLPPSADSPVVPAPSSSSCSTYVAPPSASPPSDSVVPANCPATACASLTGSHPSQITRTSMPPPFPAPALRTSAIPLTASLPLASCRNPALTSLFLVSLSPVESVSLYPSSHFQAIGTDEVEKNCTVIRSSAVALRTPIHPIRLLLCAAPNSSGEAGEHESMSMLQHQHSCSGRPDFSMHNACSRQWAGGRPSQSAWQTAASAPARARGLASAPASSDARGERGEEMGVVRATREERRARRKSARVLKTAQVPHFHSARNCLRNRLPVPKTPQSRAALRARHAPV